MSEDEIGPHCVGVYIAYPTSIALKPIYRKLKTLVNSSHTKVGITTQGFGAREREYRKTFQDEVVFLRLAEVPPGQILEIERAILKALGVRYARVGRAREWFDSLDRATIQVEILSVIARTLAPQEPEVSSPEEPARSKSTTIAPMIDWTSCPAVETDPERVSGAWVFRGTRVPVAALFENLEDGASVHDFIEWFEGVTSEQVRTVLEHAAKSALANA